MAVAHSILVIAYQLMADPEATYTDLGSDWFARRNNPTPASRAAPTAGGPVVPVHGPRTNIQRLSSTIQASRRRPP